MEKLELPSTPLEVRLANRRDLLEKQLENVILAQKYLKTNPDIVRALELLKSIFGERCL